MGRLKVVHPAWEEEARQVEEDPLAEVVLEDQLLVEGEEPLEWLEVGADHLLEEAHLEEECRWAEAYHQDLLSNNNQLNPNKKKLQILLQLKTSPRAKDKNLTKTYK